MYFYRVEKKSSLWPTPGRENSFIERLASHTGGTGVILVVNPSIIRDALGARLNIEIQVHVANERANGVAPLPVQEGGVDSAANQASSSRCEGTEGTGA